MDGFRSDGVCDNVLAGVWQPQGGALGMADTISACVLSGGGPVGHPQVLRT